MKILCTGFKGKNNSSYQLLNQISREKLYLTNSFDGLERDIMEIFDVYDIVVMFGTDSHLKNTVRIEKVAEYTGIRKVSRIDCNKIYKHLKARGICGNVSETPTEYLCNAAYYHMLNKTDGKAVFIHIPSVKNMSETMTESLVRWLENMEY